MYKQIIFQVNNRQSIEIQWIFNIEWRQSQLKQEINIQEVQTSQQETDVMLKEIRYRTEDTQKNNVLLKQNEFEDRINSQRCLIRNAKSSCSLKSRRTQSMHVQTNQISNPLRIESLVKQTPHGTKDIKHLEKKTDINRKNSCQSSSYRGNKYTNIARRREVIKIMNQLTNQRFFVQYDKFHNAHVYDNECVYQRDRKIEQDQGYYLNDRRIIDLNRLSSKPIIIRTNNASSQSYKESLNNSSLKKIHIQQQAVAKKGNNNLNKTNQISLLMESLNSIPQNGQNNNEILKSTLQRPNQNTYSSESNNLSQQIKDTSYYKLKSNAICEMVDIHSQCSNKIQNDSKSLFLNKINETQSSFILHTNRMNQISSLFPQSSCNDEISSPKGIQQEQMIPELFQNVSLGQRNGCQSGIHYRSRFFEKVNRQEMEKDISFLVKSKQIDILNDDFMKMTNICKQSYYKSKDIKINKFHAQQQQSLFQEKTNKTRKIDIEIPNVAESHFDKELEQFIRKQLKSSISSDEDKQSFSFPINSIIDCTQMIKDKKQENKYISQLEQTDLQKDDLQLIENTEINKVQQDQESEQLFQNKDIQLVKHEKRGISQNVSREIAQQNKCVPIFQLRKLQQIGVDIPYLQNKQLEQFDQLNNNITQSEKIDQQSNKPDPFILQRQISSNKELQKEEIMSPRLLHKDVSSIQQLFSIIQIPQSPSDVSTPRKKIIVLTPRNKMSLELDNEQKCKILNSNNIKKNEENEEEEEEIEGEYELKSVPFRSVSKQSMTSIRQQKCDQQQKQQIQQKLMVENNKIIDKGKQGIQHPKGININKIEIIAPIGYRSLISDNQMRYQSQSSQCLKRSQQLETKKYIPTNIQETLQDQIQQNLNNQLLRTSSNNQIIIQQDNSAYQRMALPVQSCNFSLQESSSVNIQQKTHSQEKKRDKSASKNEIYQTKEEKIVGKKIQLNIRRQKN